MDAQNRLWRCPRCRLFNVEADIHCHRCNNRRVDFHIGWVDIVRNTRLNANHSGNRECVICLTDIEDGERVAWLHCEHLHHYKCMKEWMDGMGQSCPVCRSLVPVNTVLVVNIDEDNN